MDTQMALWLTIECATILFVLLAVASDITWSHRRWWASCSIFSAFASVPLIVYGDTVGYSVPVVFFHIYMVFHLLRVYRPLQPESRLRRILLKDQLWLSGVSIASAGFWRLMSDYSLLAVERILAIASALVAGAALLSVVRNLWRSRRLPVVKTPTAQLPTVSLLIAARNEHHAIRKSLKAALESEYPKLEIIVLDDCSQDATDAVVRSFAKDGVRFIEGSLPAQGWQARNQAYDKLLDEASGEYVMVAGADVRLSPQSIRSIMQLMLNKHYDMVSLMPHRRKAGLLTSILLLPRNFWVLAWLRTEDNPPSMTTLWVANREKLQKSGGFEAVRAAINPERYFARYFAMNGRYRFLAGAHGYGVTTRKRISSQFETEVRTIYPSLRRSVVRAALASFAMVALLLVPFVAIWLPIEPVARAIWSMSVLLLVVAHLFVYVVTLPRTWIVGLVNFPLVFTLEWLLLHVSMYRYEFGEVLWKGRNVCEPINLTAIPHLPSLSEPQSKNQAQS